MSEPAGRRAAEEAFHRFLELRAAGTAPAAADYVAAQDPALHEELRALLDDYEALLHWSGQAEAGRTLGGYRLLRRLGEGAVGVVWEAVEVASGRHYALKVLRSHLALSDRALERFDREARIGERLDHPAIVAVRAAGTEGNTHYLVQDLVPGGRSLATELDRTDWRHLGPERPRKVATWFLQAARALHHAHERGVIHRDLKPGNLLLDGDRIRIADFGFAALEDHAGRSASGTVGTAAYMSPEQVAGRRNVDARTDQFSLGATFYEATCGRRPFDGEDRDEVAEQILFHEPPALGLLVPGLPPDLAAIVHQCLQKNRADRYRDCGELAQDLERFLRGQPVHARPPGPLRRALRWIERHPRSAVGVLVALAMTAAGSVWAKVEAQRTARLKDRAQYEHALGRADRELLHHRAVSARDYLGATAEWTRGLEWQLLEHRVGPPLAERVLDPAQGAVDLEADPVTHELLLCSGSRLLVLDPADLAGAPREEHSFGADVLDFAVSADGRRVLGRSGDGRALLLDREDGSVRSVAEDLGEPSVVCALPGAGFAFTTGVGDFLEIDGEGRVLRNRSGTDGWILCLAASDDGTVFAGTSEGDVCRFDPSDGDGPSRRIALDAGEVHAIRPISGTKEVLVGCDDGRVHRVSSFDGRVLDRFGEHEGGVTALDVAFGGRLVLSGGADGRVVLWHRELRRPLAETFAHDGAVHSLVLDERQGPCSLGATDALRRWPCLRVERICARRTGEGIARFSASGKLWADSSDPLKPWVDGDAVDAVVRRVPDGRTQAVLWCERPIADLAFSPDDQVLLAREEEGRLRALSLSTGLPRFQVPVPDSDLPLVFPDPEHVAVCHGDRVEFRSIADGSLVATEVLAGEDLLDVCADATAGRVLVGGRSGTLASVGKDGVRVLLRRDQPVVAVSAAPPCPLRVFAERDGHLHTFEEGAGPRPLARVFDRVADLALSAAGDRLLSLGPDLRVLRVWSVPEGNELLQWRVERSVDRVGLSADGDCVLLGARRLEHATSLSDSPSPVSPRDLAYGFDVERESRALLRSAGTVERALAEEIRKEERAALLRGFDDLVREDLRARGDDPTALLLLVEVGSFLDLKGLRAQVERAEELLPDSERVALAAALEDAREGDFERALSRLASVPQGAERGLAEVVCLLELGRREDAREIWGRLKDLNEVPPSSWWRTRLRTLGPLDR